MIDLTEFDPSVHTLGKLCRHLHDWHGTGQSLRRSLAMTCIQCEIVYRAKYRSSEKGKATEAAYWQTEQWKQARLQAGRTYRQTEYGKAKRKADGDAYYLTGRPMESVKRYNHTERGIINARLRAHRRRLNRIDDRVPYTCDDVLEVMRLFGNKCAYCGESEKKLTLDHIIPITANGIDAIWNIIPACLSCNSSKGNKDIKVWYEKKPFFTEERWEFILAYIAI